MMSCIALLAFYFLIPRSLERVEDSHIGHMVLGSKDRHHDPRTRSSSFFFFLMFFFSSLPNLFERVLSFSYFVVRIASKVPRAYIIRRLV
ncbi:hypothetical protein DE146DRAFT_184208 [Phaeosphaeria sp. MPI-PUGE-AT-0046c]|nr:hypothetical protein DE146DRAFT_184208 [Phaeosphaeria sp. MPI-PUGE-AT-0046c]